MTKKSQKKLVVSSSMSSVGSRRSSAGSKQSSVGSKQSSVFRRQSSVGSPTAALWLRALVSGVAACLSFILFPRLQYAPSDANEFAGWYGLAMGVFMWWLLSGSFEKHSGVWKYGVVVGFLLVVMSNAAMQFGWMEPGILGALMSWIVIPVAIVWLAILRELKLDNTPLPSIRRRREDGQQMLDDTPWFDSTHQPAPKMQRRTMILVTLAISIIGWLILFYRLGYYDFWEDEGLVINAAKGIQEKGLGYLADGYDRAWLHTLMVTASIQLFGESEWSARFPSALFGMIFILVGVYTIYRWLRTPWVSLLVPILCLLTNEFAILFRYTRMYAPMIPVFLAGLFCMYRFLTSPLDERQPPSRLRWYGFHMGYGAGALVLLALAVHLHPLAAIGFVGAGILIALLAFATRMKVYWYALGVGAGLALISLLLGYAEVDAFKFLPRAIKRMMRPDHPEYTYYRFLFNNGLPMNAVIITLIAGLGLLFNATVNRKLKLTIAYLLSLIFMALMLMVYIMADTGRDYRYIAHLVPLVVALSMYVVHQTGVHVLSRRFGLLLLLLPLMYAGLAFSHEAKKLYVKHPWSPRYKEAYADIRSRYKPGESILYQNMKSYYLDPDSLAGDKAIQLGRRQAMTADQFRNLYLAQQAGWIVFDTHKSYHLDQEIIKFIIRHADKIHGSGVDETGVEVFYFNNEDASSDE